MKATKVCKQKCYFLTFSVPLMTRCMALCARGTTAAPGKQKASIIELVVDNSTNNSSSNINIACSRFLPVLFSCLCFLNSADPTISEPGTG